MSVSVVSKSEVRNVSVMVKDGRETNKKHHMPKMNLKTFHIKYSKREMSCLSKTLASIARSMQFLQML